jgi:hypothetical protein
MRRSTELLVIALSGFVFGYAVMTAALNLLGAQ